MIRLDIGGGTNPKSRFVNVDKIPSADIHVDFESLGNGSRIPFPDDTVDEVYSSHCLEHVREYRGLLREIVRVCKCGARVELRVPHWASSMAMIAGHEHAMSEKQVSHWTEFPDVWWGDSRKRLGLTDTVLIPSEQFVEARPLFPHLTDDQVMRFIQDTCHEIRFGFTVILSIDGSSGVR